MTLPILNDDGSAGLDDLLKNYLLITLSIFLIL